MEKPTCGKLCKKHNKPCIVTRWNSANKQTPVGLVMDMDDPQHHHVCIDCVKSIDKEKERKSNLDFIKKQKHCAE